jgi:hypothetical protein
MEVVIIRGFYWVKGGQILGIGVSTGKCGSRWISGALGI